MARVVLLTTLLLMHTLRVTPVVVARLVVAVLLLLALGVAIAVLVVAVVEVEVAGAACTALSVRGFYHPPRRLRCLLLISQLLLFKGLLALARVRLLLLFLSTSPPLLPPRVRHLLPISAVTIPIRVMPPVLYRRIISVLFTLPFGRPPPVLLLLL